MGSYTKPTNKRKMETMLPEAVVNGTTAKEALVKTVQSKRAKMSEDDGVEDRDGDVKIKEC